MHLVNENSGGQHPAGFLLTGMRARRMAHRGDSHPARRAMHSERKPFCGRRPFVHLESLVTCKIKHVAHYTLYVLDIGYIHYVYTYYIYIASSKLQVVSSK